MTANATTPCRFVVVVGYMTSPMSRNGFYRRYYTSTVVKAVAGCNRRGRFVFRTIDRLHQGRGYFHARGAAAARAADTVFIASVASPHGMSAAHDVTLAKAVLAGTCKLVGWKGRNGLHVDEA